jgi:predicted acylesterase/phospholipase RssA
MTFNLGVLAALSDYGKLNEIDYLSGVSGDAYIGSWFVAHLLPRGAMYQNTGYEWAGSATNVFDQRGVLAYSQYGTNLLNGQVTLSANRPPSGHLDQPASDLPLLGHPRNNRIPKL